MHRMQTTQTFLSAPSARRATTVQRQHVYKKFYFYPRPLRGGRLYCFFNKFFFKVISIHALCEEGDRTLFYGPGLPCYFYPRPLRGGRRANPSPLSSGTEFLSTPSARRATLG